jgi:uncharacterized membrane protein YjjP (DUF1212 family)
MTSILEISLRAGKIMLENGGNTSLVEESIQRLGTGLGADSVEVSVNPGSIVASLVSGQEQETRLRRVSQSGVELSKLARVLHLVSGVESGKMSASEAESELQRIEGLSRQYPPWLVALAVGLGCGAFAVNLGGTARDFYVVLVTSSLAQLLRHHLAYTRLGRLLTTVVVAAFASATALALAGPGVSVAASILLLVPGVPLVSSTADLFRGDVTAGLTRATSALLTIIAASVGVWGVILAWGRPAESGVLPGQDQVLLAALMGGVAAVGFAVLFDVPRRYLLGSGLVGLVAILTRASVAAHAWPAEVANLLAGFSIGLSSELLARRAGCPYSFMAMPGYIPLVPGAVFFSGILHLVAGDYLQGLASLIQAQIILLAIALGMGSIPALFSTSRKAIA